MRRYPRFSILKLIITNNNFFIFIKAVQVDFFMQLRQSLNNNIFLIVAPIMIWRVPVWIEYAILYMQDHSKLSRQSF